MKPYYENGSVRLFCADCFDVLPALEHGSVNAVVTSPPYAMQRRKLYGGIPETEYPVWTLEWMRLVRPLLAPGASVFIVIREHVRNGGISDYVHRTRLALREDGWTEVDEIIWVKPNSIPIGRVDRPRRSWERVLWFAQTGNPVCYPKANGRASDRIGCIASRQALKWGVRPSDGYRSGIARCSDVAVFSPRLTPSGVNHPAVYPAQLAAWLIRLVTRPGDIVLDPFCGSGSTGVACINEGRRFIGIEKEREYAAEAKRRIAEALGTLFADGAA